MLVLFVANVKQYTPPRTDLFAWRTIAVTVTMRGAKKKSGIRHFFILQVLCSINIDRAHKRCEFCIFSYVVHTADLKALIQMVCITLQLDGEKHNPHSAALAHAKTYLEMHNHSFNLFIACYL